MPFPVNRDCVTAAEEKLGVRFPAIYVSCLMEENGGGVVAADDHWRLHTILDTTDRQRLKRSGVTEIVRETERVREFETFPADGVPIASNATGDLLVLLPSQDDATQLDERVHMWFHDAGEEFMKPVGGNLRELRLAAEVEDD